MISDVVIRQYTHGHKTSVDLPEVVLENKTHTYEDSSRTKHGLHQTYHCEIKALRDFQLSKSCLLIILCRILGAIKNDLRTI